MTECKSFPFFPDAFVDFVGKVQAQIVIEVWNAAGEAYALCSENQAALVQWIRAGSTEE